MPADRFPLRAPVPEQRQPSLMRMASQRYLRHSLFMRDWTLDRDNNRLDANDDLDSRVNRLQAQLEIHDGRRRIRTLERLGTQTTIREAVQDHWDMRDTYSYLFDLDITLHRLASQAGHLSELLRLKGRHDLFALVGMDVDIALAAVTPGLGTPDDPIDAEHYQTADEGTPAEPSDVPSSRPPSPTPPSAASTPPATAEAGTQTEGSGDEEDLRPAIAQTEAEGAEGEDEPIIDQKGVHLDSDGSPHKFRHVGGGPSPIDTYICTYCHLDIAEHSDMIKQLHQDRQAIITRVLTNKWNRAFQEVVDNAELASIGEWDYSVESSGSTA